MELQPLVQTQTRECLQFDQIYISERCDHPCEKMNKWVKRTLPMNFTQMKVGHQATTGPFPQNHVNVSRQLATAAGVNTMGKPLKIKLNAPKTLSTMLSGRCTHISLAAISETSLFCNYTPYTNTNFQSGNSR